MSVLNIIARQLNIGIQLEALMYCTNCGKELKEGSLFCENCGTKIQDSVDSDYVESSNENVDISGIDVNVYPMAEPVPKKEPVIAQTVPLPSVDMKEEPLSIPASVEPPKDTQPTKKRNLLIAAIAVLAIIVAALIVLLVLNISNHEETTASMPNSNNASIQKTEEPESQIEREGTGSISSNDKASQGKNANKSSEYVLPESDLRYFSDGELSALSDYELYLARNEIFARHGREFKNQDLCDYFGSKSWYFPQYSPEEFDSMNLLNAYEKKNADAMLSIEQKRGSSYLN